MSNQSASLSSNGSVVDWRALLRSVLPMVFVWTGWVVLATVGGYPGVVCMTPMAWLMALWTGGQYAGRTAGQAGRWPLLGPALAGAVLGFYLGLTFVVVGAFALPADITSEELSQTWVFNLIVLAISVPICAGMSVLVAQLARRRFAGQQGAR